MANLMVEAGIYLIAAAAVGFMTAWLASRARWSRREAELASRYERMWDEPEDTRSMPLASASDASSAPIAPQVSATITPEVLVAGELDLGEPEVDPGPSEVEASASARPEPGSRRRAAGIAALALPQSPSGSAPPVDEPRRSRLAAVLKTPEYSYPLEVVVDGIQHGGQLRALGLRSTLDLLRKCPGPSEVASVAASTGIDVKALRRWTAMADLMRMEHVRSAEARQLFDAGIDSSQALAHDDAVRVAARLATGNGSDPGPTVSTVAGWIVNARALPPRLRD